MTSLQIYRNGAVFRTVKIGLDTTYQGQFMGENKVVSNFSTPSVIKFKQGDYIIHKGAEWRLNEMPTESRTSRNKITYNAVFEGREYTWNNKQVMHLGVSDFSYFGTPLELIQLLVSNINEIDPGWIIGTVDNTAEPQHFQFKDVSCRQGLTIAAEAFGMEFAWNNRTIDFKNTIATVVPNVTLSYGMHKGLYSLTRQPASDARVATRVYGYGSSQNIPADYRGGLTRLTFAERKIDNNIDLYGVIEASVTFDDIRPERTASITGTTNSTTVIDSTLDFDLNNVIIKGQAKIVFKSGDLQGNEFLITSYNHASRTIRFEANKEENGTVFPSGAVKPSIGDQYTLIGIIMPQSYITAAEARVKQETINYAESIKVDNYLHQLAIDQIEAKENGLDVSLKLGYKLHVVDTEMDVDETLRVQSLSYPLINPAKITATITDKVTYTRAERVRQIIAKQEEAIREIIKGSAELQRISSIRREELQELIFDPDGYFDTDNIRPLSINTSHIAVGSRSQEYSLSVIFKPNVDGDKARIDWTTGVLTHFTIDETIKTWNISQGSRASMVDNTAYYIYARCSKTGTTGTIVLDTVQRKADSDPNFYYFLIGVLSSVIDGIRWPTLTYGTTEINGGFIRTGRIESNDGKAWLDLTTSQFQLGDINGGLDWNVTKPNQLTIVGRIVATEGNIGGIEINPITGKLEVSLQKVTEAGPTTDRIITAKGVRATSLISFPLQAPNPADIIAGEKYAWFGSTGQGSPTPPVGVQYFKDLLDVTKPLSTGWLKFDQATGMVVSDPNGGGGGGDATQAWVQANFAPISHTHPVATTSANGFMSSADKVKLNGIATGANNYTHPPKAWVDKTALTGATVISNLTIDSLGHPTNWVTRNLTPANIGAEPAFAKLTGFNKNFGAAAGTVAQGNDSRINNGQTAYGWGDHKTYNIGNYLGGNYNGSGAVATSPSQLGSGKLRLQMISGTNLGMPESWYDVLWMSSYTGSDVKRSTAIISSKFGASDEIGFIKNAWDDNSWGNYRRFWHSGNLRSDTQNDSRFVLKTGDTMTGPLRIQGNGTSIITLLSPEATGNNFINFLNASGVQTSYIGHGSTNNNIQYFIPSANSHVFYTGGVNRLEIGNTAITSQLRLILSGTSSTVSGLLSMTSSGVKTDIGSANSGYFHMNTAAGNGFYMYQDLNALNLIARTKLTAPSIQADQALSIPTVPPPSGMVVSGKRYIWIKPS